MQQTILYGMLHIIQKLWPNEIFERIDKAYLKNQIKKIKIARNPCHCHPDLATMSYTIDIDDYCFTDYETLSAYYWSLQPVIKKHLNGRDDETWLLMPVQDFVKQLIVHPEFLAIRQRYP